MRRSKAIAASLMALTLALGGGLAYAAGTDSSASVSSSVASDQASPSGGQQDKHGKFAGKHRGFAQLAGLESKLADYLKLSAEELKTKLETSTLAEVGAAQGISREDLKTKLVEWIDAAAAAMPKKEESAAEGDSIKKPDSSAIADKLLDSKGFEGKGFGGPGGNHGGFVGPAGLESKLADYLKLSAEELKTKLETSTLAEIGAAQGISREDLKTKLVEWIDAAAAAAPKKDDTAAEEDSVQKPDSSAIADKLLDSKGFVAEGKGFVSKGQGHGGVFVFGDKEALAKLLGLTSDELETALKDGQTLAALADKQGVNVQSVIDLEVNTMKAKLDEALASGKLTQEEYDAKLKAVTDEVTKQVNGEWEAPKGGRGGFEGGTHFGGGHGGKRQGEAGQQAVPAASSSTTA